MWEDGEGTLLLMTGHPSVSRRARNDVFFRGLEGEGEMRQVHPEPYEGKDGASTSIGGIASRGRKFNSKCLEYFHVVKEVSVVSDTGYMPGDQFGDHI